MTATRELVQKAVESNLIIQRSLSHRAAQLEAQLKQLDDLIDNVHKGVPTEEIPDNVLESEFQIPGSKRANGPIPSFELLSRPSPFYKEAAERAYYLRWTTFHPIKGKEAEALADGVRRENLRLEACRAQNNPSAPPIDIQNNVHGVNWSIVAEKVSDNSSIKRTPGECRIQWIGNLHPKVNHSDWTMEELHKLHNLTTAASATGEQHDWARIAKELETNRIPLECMTRATARPRHCWDVHADQRLLEAVQRYGTNNWNLVARYVSPFATTSQCQTRYVRSVNPSIKRVPWTPEEDARLRKAVEVFKNAWVDVAGVLPGRTNEQCRERWLEVGGAKGAKGQWSEEEDQSLMAAVVELGHKWKRVSERVGGRRTGQNCRLRYDRILKSRSKQSGASPAPEITPAKSLAEPPSLSLPQDRIVPALPNTPKTATSYTGNTPAQTQVNSGPENGKIGGAQPALETGAESVVPRVRPKPRPVRKDKGKDRVDTSTGVNLEAASEIDVQPTTSPEDWVENSAITTASPLAALIPSHESIKSQQLQQQEPETSSASSVRLRSPTEATPSRVHELEQTTHPIQEGSIHGRERRKAGRRGKRRRDQDTNTTALGEAGLETISQRRRKRHKKTAVDLEAGES